MSCSTAHQGDSLLHCYFPVEDILALAVYFCPKSGHERMVVNCMQSDEFECDNENGFILEASDSNHADIKLPKSFIKETGSFRCQIPGFSATDLKTCLWPPTGFPADGNITAGITAPTTTGKYSLEETSGRNQSIGVGVGVGVGVGAVLIILILVAIVIIKRLVLRKNKGIKDKEQRLQEHYVGVNPSKECPYYPLPQSDAFEKEAFRSSNGNISTTETNDAKNLPSSGLKEDLIRNMDKLWILSEKSDSHELDSKDVLTNEQTPGNEEVNSRSSKPIRQQEPALHYESVYSIKAQPRKEQDGNSRNKEESWNSTEEDLSQEDTTPSYPLDNIKDQSGSSDGNISTTETNDAKNLFTSGLKEDLICSSQESEKSEECLPSSKGASFM